MTRSATWWVPGIPQPQGSLRRAPGSFKLFSDNPQLGPWRDGVAMVSKLHAAMLRIERHEPVLVALRFDLPRPQSVRRQRPAVKPDLDKLERACLDALTMAGVLVDDGQVCGLAATKRYAEPTACGVMITLRVLDDDEAGG